MTMHLEQPWIRPDMDFLFPLSVEHAPPRMDPAEDRAQADRLLAIFRENRIEAALERIDHGPAVTRFALNVAPGVHVKEITALSRAIGLGMDAHPVFIEAPIPFTRLIGVSLPNPRRNRAIVSYPELLRCEGMQQSDAPLLFPLGRSFEGEPVLCNLAKMPHLLLGGATGAGKSVCLHTLIATLMLRCTPAEVRFLLIDPKGVEFACYDGVPHLLHPPVTNPEQGLRALSWACDEMMRRYDVMQRACVRTLDMYNASGEEKLPRIVIVIDELLDLTLEHREDTWEALTRLEALGRGAGIHMAVSTQHPAPSVLSGELPEHFPSRIALRLHNEEDSRYFLGRPGAQLLLDSGDMLYQPSRSFSSQRVQGCYLREKDVAALVDALRRNGPPVPDASLLCALSAPGDGDPD